MTDKTVPPRLTPRAFGHGNPTPLFVRANRRTGELEFCRNEARFDGRGAGRKTLPPLPEELTYARTLAAARLTLRRIAGRAFGSKSTAAKGAKVRAEIQAFALSVGWPARHATKKIVAHFAPIGGKAPKHLRRGERTVKAALGHLRKQSE